MTSTEHQPTTTLLQRARSAANLAPLEQAQTDIAQRIREASSSARDKAAETKAITAEVIATGVVRSDLGQWALELQDHNARATAAVQTLQNVHKSVQRELQNRRRTGADAALAVLADELSTIVEAARPVFDALGEDVTDAESAIDHHRGAAWREATSLAGRHLELREAQRVLTSNAMLPVAGVPDDVDDRVALHVDLLGHVQHPEQWTDLALHIGAGEAVLGGRPDPRYVPSMVEHNQQLRSELVDREHTAPWLVADTVAALRFLAREDVAPWVPSVSELRRARDEVQPWQPEQEQQDERPRPPAEAARLEYLASQYTT